MNLPILSDEERHQIGTTYREKGQDAAIQQGHALVSGAVREARIDAWAEGIARDPGAVIYCFRGGLRSQITQSWLAERGIHRPIVEGGYKALRRFLIEAIDRRAGELSLSVVSGPTGSGKTKYLHSQNRPFIDLEELAAHRGSAFGATTTPQPTQIDFENALALALLKLPDGDGKVLIEDESRMIGKRFIPHSLFQKMSVSSRINLEVSLEDRVENIFQDYIVDSSLGRTGDLGRLEEFRVAVQAISRKLGDEMTRAILRDIDLSQAESLAGAGLDSNKVWIRKILERYYDPLYQATALRHSKKSYQK